MFALREGSKEDRPELCRSVRTPSHRVNFMNVRHEVRWAGHVSIEKLMPASREKHVLFNVPGASESLLGGQPSDESALAYAGTHGSMSK